MISRPALTAVLVLAAVAVMMLLEAALSRHNERVLRVRGAIEPADDVYRWMQVAYPLAFVVMAVEGALQPVLPQDRLLWGIAVFTVAKGIKYWAISTLGPRWSFRVLVEPGAPLVTTGPYRFLRHPNYLGVVGELAGVALMLSAPIAGTIATLGFAVILWRRIRVEDRALGRHG